MRTLLTVGLAVLCTLANAQSAMRPSDLVEARIKNNVTFKTIHLFERAPELRSEPQVVNGLWMFLNTASIIPLQRERPLALSLPLPNADGTMMELELVQVDIFSADFVVQFSQQSNTSSSNMTAPASNVCDSPEFSSMTKGLRAIASIGCLPSVPLHEVGAGDRACRKYPFFSGIDEVVAPVAPQSQYGSEIRCGLLSKCTSLSSGSM